MTTFRHAGRMGDVLYSLYFALHFTRGEAFDYVLLTNVRAWDPSNRPVMMSKADAEFTAPLLEAQPYINRVTITDNPHVQNECYVLDGFRRDMRRIIGKEIRTWYYGPRERIPEGEFSRPVLTVPDHGAKIDKLAICFTPRYRQQFNLEPLREYRDKIVFVGLPTEHEAFCREHFSVDYAPVLNALELLQFVSACRGFVGNVSGTFAIMECAKIPRILCVEPNGGNVRPQGGICFEARDEYALRNQLKILLGELK